MAEPREKLFVESPVVVLNAHHSGLGIARNLGPLGVRVIALSAYRDFPGNCSRWLEFRPSPDSLEDPAGLLATLERLAAELGRKAVLFPTRDHDVAFVSHFRDELEFGYLLPFLSQGSLEAVMNKDQLFEVARTVGIDVPESILLTAPGDLEQCHELTFPVIIKPVYARQWRHPKVWEAVGRNKAAEARDEHELQAFVDRVSVLDPLMTVQEKIPGGDRNLLIFGSYSGEGGDIIAFFTGRKRLQVPAGRGTGVIVEGSPVPEVVKPAVRLLQALSFRGVSEIEFKRDERNGRLYLIEINPRHWDQHRLGTAVGVNLSEAAYRDATGQPSRRMAQRLEPALWIADSEVVGQAVRALVGRAPMSVFSELRGARRTFAVFDAGDIRPALSAVLGPLVRRFSQRDSKLG